MALHGWHIGERAIRHKMKYDEDPALQATYTHISDELDPSRASFFGQCHFLPLTTLDSSGRPWGSILAPNGGTPGPGFIRSTGRNKIRLMAEVWEGDPILRTGRDEMLVAGIGIEFSTRRRNKMAGYATSYQRERENKMVQLDMTVTQTIGNCPKYINLRHLSSHPNTHPRIAAESLHLAEGDRLPDQLIDFILGSDTVFIGTTYVAPEDEAKLYPSHLGMNQRGGRKGFVRVSRKDGRTVAVPDYSGNRILTSIGNIEVTPLASLTFVDFKSGAILYLTGDATNLLGADAKRVMPMHNRMPLTSVLVTGYSFVLDALPARQTDGTDAEPSPYSPPVRFLAEEAQDGTILGNNDDVLLTRIDIHSPDIATFWFRCSTALTILPGQAAILSFGDLLGQPAYAHMAPSDPKSLNDDRVRTWTVSALTSSGTDFALTMREIPGGVVTGALFNIARALSGSTRPELLSDTSSLDIRVGLVGITGSFCLPPAVKVSTNKLLWIAGGMGFTPFLSMLRALKADTGTSQGAKWDIHMVLSTRDPDVLLPLLVDAADIQDGRVKFSLDLFTTKAVELEKQSFGICLHHGRVTSEFLLKTSGSYGKVFLCGPRLFEETVVKSLAGGTEVIRESFEY